MGQLWSEVPEISVAQTYFLAQIQFEIEFPVIDYSEGLKNKWCLIHFQAFSASSHCFVLGTYCSKPPVIIKEQDLKMYDFIWHLPNSIMLNILISRAFQISLGCSSWGTGEGHCPLSITLQAQPSLMVINTQGWSWDFTSQCDYLSWLVLKVGTEINEEQLLCSSLMTKWCWEVLPLSDVIWSCHRFVHLEVLIPHNMDEEPDKKQVWGVFNITFPCPQGNSHAGVHQCVTVAPHLKVNTLK